MKKVLRIMMAGMMILLLTAAGNGWADEAKPKTNNGKTWRIGYYEGGEYIDYQRSLIAMVKGFMETGWIEKKEIPEQEGAQTNKLWEWLASELKSPYIVFIKDGHYSAQWNKAVTPQMTEDIIKRLNEKKDIDLMIAAGTKAGKNLANNRHHVPTVVISTSAPVKAGIIKSVRDSGYDHIHARVDPRRYERQVRIFHNVVKFKRLGLAYEESESGRIHGAISQVEKVAKKRGFELVRCSTIGSTNDKNAAAESVKQCFRELCSQNVDAIYVTLQTGVNKESIYDLAAIASQCKIPTFSQSGSKEVKAGIMMSMSKVSFDPVGKFYAKTAAAIFNGAKPRELNQIFKSPPKIAINLKTAEDIGIIDTLPVRLLRTADEIFQDVEKPKP